MDDQGRGLDGIAGRGTRVVLLLMAISFLCYVNRVSMAAAGDTRIMSQYGIEPVKMGSVYTAFLLTYMIFMIPGGWVIDRFGPRKALMLVTAGSSVFVALTGLVGILFADGGLVLLSLLVVRGLMGIVSAPLYPSCAAAVGAWVPAEVRSRTNGLVTGAALVGVAITPFLFGKLIDAVDWPFAFLIASVLTIGLAAGWWVGTRDYAGVVIASPGTPRDETPTSWRSVVTDRSLLLLTLSYGAVGYFQYLFFYWMNYYFETVLKLPADRSRALAAVPPLAMAVGMPLGGWLNDRVERAVGRGGSRRIVPMVGMAAGGAFLISGVFVKDPVWITVLFSLALGAVGAAEGPFWVTAIELGGKRGGASAAFFNTGGNAGGMLAPILTPLVGQTYGWPWAIALGGAVCLAGVLLWLGIDFGGNRPAPGENRP